MYPHYSRVGRSVFLDKEGDPSGNGKVKRGFLPDMSDEELEASLRPLIATQAKGDLMRACKILKRDNAKVRDQNRKANEALQKSTELPEVDSLLLAAAKKAKLTPELLDTVMKENKDLKAKDAKSQFSGKVGEAAKVAGVNAKVLEDQLVLNKQHLEMRDIHVEEQNEKKEKVVVLKKVPHVRPEGDANAPLTPLHVWMGTLDKPYQQALKIKEDGTTAKDGTTSFVAYPDQPDGGKAPSQARATDSYLKTAYGQLPAIPGLVDPTKSATQGA